MALDQVLAVASLPAGATAVIAHALGSRQEYMK